MVPCRALGWAGRYWIWECGSFFVHYPAKSLISVFQIWTRAFHPPTRMFGAHLNTSKLKCYISSQWKLVWHKEGNMNETSSASVHFQYVFGSLGKPLLTGWGKMYSIPKCDLQRAQLSQKKIFFLKVCSVFLGLNKESAISDSNLWDLKLKHRIQYTLTFL